MNIKEIMNKDVVSAKLPGNRTDLLRLMVTENKTAPFAPHVVRVSLK